MLVAHVVFNMAYWKRGFPGGSESKESACNAGVPGLIPRSEGSFGEGKGNALQYSCLEKSMDRGAWWAPWDRRELDMTEQLTLPLSPTRNPFC